MISINLTQQYLQQIQVFTNRIYQIKARLGSLQVLNIILYNYQRLLKKKVQTMVTDKNNRFYQECQVLVKRVKIDNLIETQPEKTERSYREQQETRLENMMKNLTIEEEQTSISIKSDIFDLSSIESSLSFIEDIGDNPRYRKVNRQKMKNEAYCFYLQLWLQLKKNACLRRIQNFHQCFCININSSYCKDLEEYGDRFFQKLKSNQCLSQCFEHVPQNQYCVSLNFLRIMHQQLKEAIIDSVSPLDIHNVQTMFEETEKPLISLNKLTNR